jgi:hypothetical protein
METTVKVEKSTRSKDRIIVPKRRNNLDKLYGLYKGLISYESDEIFKSYRTQCDVVL